MYPWEFEYHTDPITKVVTILFGNDLLIEQRGKPPYDHIVRYLAGQPKGSAIVVGSGVVALNDSKYGDTEYDLQSAIKEAVELDSVEAICHLGAEVEHAWQRIERRIERTRFRP